MALPNFNKENRLLTKIVYTIFLTDNRSTSYIYTPCRYNKKLKTKELRYSTNPHGQKMKSFEGDRVIYTYRVATTIFLLKTVKDHQSLSTVYTDETRPPSDGAVRNLTKYPQTVV